MQGLGETLGVAKLRPPRLNRIETHRLLAKVLLALLVRHFDLNRQDSNGCALRQSDDGSVVGIGGGLRVDVISKIARNFEYFGRGGGHFHLGLTWGFGSFDRVGHFFLHSIAKLDRAQFLAFVTFLPEVQASAEVQRLWVRCSQ